MRATWEVCSSNLESLEPSKQHPSHQTHSLRHRTPDLQTTTTLGQYTTLL